jgi:flagellar hook-basal body complex protein FliE
MRIGAIGSDPSFLSSSAVGAKSAGSLGNESFGSTIKNAIGEVNSLQDNADQLAQKLATGDVQDIHQVMLALDKASVAFGATVQVRNKAIESYQEIMRMQV